MRSMPLGWALVGVALLSGCSASTSSDSTSPDSTPAATAGASTSQEPIVGVPWVLPSPSSTQDAAVIWCSALNPAVTTVSNAAPTRGGAQKKMDALVSYEKLWDLAVTYGYVTAEEADVNKRYLQGYEELTQLETAGKDPTGKEIADVGAAMNKLTADSKALFDSSATKITALCSGSPAPVPSTSSPVSPSSSAGN